MLNKVKLTIIEHQQVPDEGKEQPGEHEGGGEAQQCPRPREVNHRDEKVLQIPEQVQGSRRTGFLRIIWYDVLFL